jgi:hypothetical protein
MGLENLNIWQQNVNKSATCQQNLLNDSSLTKMGINILALQEPAINGFNYTTASKDWTVIYPSSHVKYPKKTRAITMIRTSLRSDSWRQLDFPSSDVTVIEISGDWGACTTVNIYNDGASNATIGKLTEFHESQHAGHAPANALNRHTIWLGDFNRHHPHWDDPGDTRLFNEEALAAAELHIEAVAGAGLELALLAGLPTHLHNVTKRWTCLDQVFLSDHSLELLITCDTQLDKRGICTDHLPIITALNVMAVMSPNEEFHNFREVDWETFSTSLGQRLASCDPPDRIHSQTQLDSCCSKLTKAIQDTIKEAVPTTTLTPKLKRWWTKELTTLRRKANRLGQKAYKCRGVPEHQVHADHAAAVRTYKNTLEKTKKQHWLDWLERAEDPDIWSVHQVTSLAPSDGGKARIPLGISTGNPRVT